MVAPNALLTVSALLLAPCASLVLLPGAPLSTGAGRTSSVSMLFGGGGKDGEGGGLNMMETIKKAQEVGVKVKELQEELVGTEIEAVAADGGVTVVISGAQVPVSVEVTDELLAQGAEAVSTAVSLAAKEAHTNSMNYAKERMGALYSEIGLPLPPT